MTVDIPQDRTTMTTLERSMPDRSFVRATVGLSKLGGNASAYWSLTGELYESHGKWSGAAQFRNGREPDTCGQIRGEVLRAFPKLAPFAALHLSDPDGVPMHAVANGRYFIERGDLDTAARHFRCTIEELPTSDGVESFVADQAPRWRAESEAAYALLQELIA